MPAAASVRAGSVAVGSRAGSVAVGPRAGLLTAGRRADVGAQGVLGESGQGVRAGLLVGAVVVLAVAGRVEGACEDLAAHRVEPPLEEGAVRVVGHVQEPRASRGGAGVLKAVVVVRGHQGRERARELPDLRAPSELHDLRLRRSLAEHGGDGLARVVHRAREHVRVAHGHDVAADGLTHLVELGERLRGADLTRRVEPRRSGEPGARVEEGPLAPDGRRGVALRDEHGGAQRRDETRHVVQHPQHPGPHRRGPGCCAARPDARLREQRDHRLERREERLPVLVGTEVRGHDGAVGGPARLDTTALEHVFDPTRIGTTRTSSSTDRTTRRTEPAWRQRAFAAAFAAFFVSRTWPSETASVTSAIDRRAPSSP